jgi:hypothetical protein
MTKTENLLLPLLAQNQAQKEIIVNEALVTIDALLNCGVKLMDITKPVDEPQNGELYIIGDNAEGEWKGKEKQLAYYYQGWRFIKPNEGLTLWVIPQQAPFTYNGKEWISNLESNQLGINTKSDSINRLAVRSEALLFTAEKENIQLKINKASPSATASYLFQSGYQSHAEFGLVGNNNFQLKVSPDGKNFHQSMEINRENGDVYFTGSVYGIDKAVVEAAGTSYSIDIKRGNIFEITLSDNCKIMLPGKELLHKTLYFTLILNKNKGKIVEWPDNIKWAAGIPPAGVLTIIKFITTNGGNTWYGA